jgi:hypothetical protein
MKLEPLAKVRIGLSPVISADTEKAPAEAEDWLHRASVHLKLGATTDCARALRETPKVDARINNEKTKRPTCAARAHRF